MKSIIRNVKWEMVYHYGSFLLFISTFAILLV